MSYQLHRGISGQLLIQNTNAVQKNFNIHNEQSQQLKPAHNSCDITNNIFVFFIIILLTETAVYSANVMKVDNTGQIILGLFFFFFPPFLFIFYLRYYYL